MHLPAFTSRKKKNARLNLRRHLLPGALILFSLATLVYVYQSDWRPPEQPDLTATYRAEAQQYAASFADSLQGLNQRLDALAAQPGLAEQLAGQESVLLTEADALLPGLLSLRLIAPRTTQITDHARPTLSYACFDLVADSSKPDKVVPIEAHLYGADVQHIDFVRPIRNEEGEWVGGLLASFSITLLSASMPAVSEGKGYFELQQAGQPLARAGGHAERGLDPYTSAVHGSRWRMAYWPATRELEQAVDYAGQRLLAVGVIALMIFVSALLLAFRNGRHSKPMPDDKNEVAMPAEKHEEDTVSLTSSILAEEIGSDVLFQSTDGLLVVDEEAAMVGGDDVQTEAGSKLDASIFKAYDIRGIVDKTLTEEVVYNVGRAFGSEARAQGETKVLVARDGRNSGPALLARLSDGLRAAGIDVISIGMVPTPVLYFAAQTLGTGSGIMVTGSHNPPDYNGLKMVIAGNTLASEEIQALRQRIETNDFDNGAGSFMEQDVLEQYIKRISGDVMLLKRFKVVVDCGNGAAGVAAPQLLKELGCDVVELYCEVDGNFPNHHPDPSRPENLKDLIAAVKEQQADLGLAFDGDGDRIGVVTREGKIIWPDRTMMLYAMDILARNPGAEIIFDVKCSRKLAEVIREHGGVATMWQTGHSLIKRKMKESGALLAGEMSGHIFFKERWYGFDDGLYSAARLVELLGPMTADKTVAEVFDALPDSVNTPEINISMAEGQHHAYMEKFVAQASFEDAEITTIDGVRVDFADGWGLVRASNTTPVLVLRFEADSEEALERIKKIFREQMRAVEPGINLSF
ncbi:phosphomannomutase/phosphoglucomutase [Sulfuriflexus mobilis]|uniref:phosphomannomutase/phosphoglucomutase n=1 Tax=Sulfuriflexus mobilis TaxID=1811807 RepID=UPI000F8401C7|nr:phosphomannomutase/phosphoglucomutase [Sulfuriflexus mobilis]